MDLHHFQNKQLIYEYVYRIFVYSQFISLFLLFCLIFVFFFFQIIFTMNMMSTHSLN